jgi:hypothetical protein
MDAEAAASAVGRRILSIGVYALHTIVVATTAARILPEFAALLPDGIEAVTGG